jgi:hypothetical protein
MNIEYLVYEILSLVIAFVFYKYFTKPTKIDREKARKEGLSEELIESISISNKLQDIKGWFVVVTLTLLGIICLYLAMKN